MTIATDIKDLKQDIMKLNETARANHETYVEPYLTARRNAEAKLHELEEQLDISKLSADTVRDKYPGEEKQALEVK
jgi:hypothetical protein